MKLSTIQKYAAVTGQTLRVEGESSEVSFLSVGCHTALIAGGYVSPSVVVGDASSSTGFHVVRFFAEDMMVDKLYFRCRQNGANGAEQATAAKERLFKEHVAEVLGVEMQEL